jgi:hypothetical protein
LPGYAFPLVCFGVAGARAESVVRKLACFVVVLSTSVFWAVLGVRGRWRVLCGGRAGWCWGSCWGRPGLVRAERGVVLRLLRECFVSREGVGSGGCP